MRNLFSTFWILFLTSFLSVSLAGSLFSFSVSLQKEDDLELVDENSNDAVKGFETKTEPDSDKDDAKKEEEPLHLGKELAKALFGKYLK